MKNFIFLFLLTTNLAFATEPCSNCDPAWPVYLGDGFLPAKSQSGFSNKPMMVGVPYTVRCNFFVKNFNRSALLGIKWSGFNSQNIEYVVNDEEIKPIGQSWDARLTLTQEYNVVYFKHVIKQQESNETLSVITGLEAISNYLVYSCVLMQENQE